MLNKIILVGNATMDIESKADSQGGLIVRTGIAVNRTFKTKNGVQKKEVLFIDLNAFGRVAENMQKYLKKGSKFLVEGRLKYDTWTDENGGQRNKHTITVEFVEFLDKKDDSGKSVSVREDIPGNGIPATPDTSSATPEKAPEVPVVSGTPQPENSAPSDFKSNVPVIDIDEDEIPF